MSTNSRWTLTNGTDEQEKEIMLKFARLDLAIADIEEQENKAKLIRREYFQALDDLKLTEQKMSNLKLGKLDKPAFWTKYDPNKPYVGNN